MAPPAVSLIMPAHNVAGFVGTAVDSVLAQSLRDWELFVVDDGSADGTDKVVAARPDPRIRLVRQSNAGVSAARNRGLSEARGAAVLFLDADDWLAVDALARLHAALQAAPRAVAAYGAYAFMAEHAGPDSHPLRVKAGPFPAGDILECLVVQNLFANGGHLLARRRAVQAAGLFARHIRYGEDWEYWVRLALQGPFTVVPGEQPLLYVRERMGSAYRRMAHDPGSFTPAMDAIFDNPALAGRLGPARVAQLRRRAWAENDWIVGRELLRHGARESGLRALRRSLAAAPSAKRALLLAMAHLGPLLPPRMRGPFGHYA